MAMDLDRNSSRTRRLRRWLIGIGVGVLVLGGYAFSLNWFANRLGDDMNKAIRVPTVSADQETSGGSY